MKDIYKNINVNISPETKERENSIIGNIKYEASEIIELISTMQYKEVLFYNESKTFNLPNKEKIQKKFNSFTNVLDNIINNNYEINIMNTKLKECKQFYSYLVKYKNNNIDIYNYILNEINNKDIEKDSLSENEEIVVTHPMPKELWG